MRYWLLTNTTYGTWLPGDQRGSVTSVRDRRVGEAVDDQRRRHNRPGEAWEAPIAGLANSARSRMKGSPIWLTAPQAEVLLRQLQETATYRGWLLKSIAIMANHFHLVVGVVDDSDPRKILADFKAYGTRALNRDFGRPRSGRWWTTSGSKRQLPDGRAIAAAVNYVFHKQPNPLVTWTPGDVTDD